MQNQTAIETSSNLPDSVSAVVADNAAVVAIEVANPVREPVKINRVNLRTFIKESKGRLMSLNYIKNNGSVRRLIGRTGVRSYLKGGVNNVERLDRPYLTMFDMQLREYRTVSLDTLMSFKFNGVNYQVVD